MAHNNRIPICAINHKGELLSYYDSLNECIRMNGFPANSVYKAFEKRRVYRCMLFIRESEYRDHWESRTTHLLAFKTQKERNMDKNRKMMEARSNSEVEERRRRNISETLKIKKKNGVPMGIDKAVQVLMRPIRCVDTGVVYPSISEAARQIGTVRTAVSRALRKNYLIRGKKFEYVKKQ